MTPLPALADVPKKLEPDYAEAILAYNSKDYGKALTLLGRLIQKSPGTTEFLELKALSHKGGKDDKEAAATYLALIEAKKKAGAPEKEIAPYHFELGMMDFKADRKDVAREHFRASAKHGFNPGPSNLYLGMMAFKDGAWGESEAHFDEVVSSKAEDLKPVAYFYLGQAYLKSNYLAGVTDSFLSARARAQGIVDSPTAGEGAKKIAQEIRDAADKALSPFDQGKFFANLGFMSGYDSNLLSVPTDSSSAEEVSGKSSPKQQLLIGAGYMGSPLGFLQLVPSYRGSMNLNLNSDAKATQFIFHSASLYLNRAPLSRLSYGAKVEGSLNFKHDGSTFRPYTKGLDVGPYVRFEVVKKVIAGIEVFRGMRSYEQDGTGDSRRSGGAGNYRFFAQNDSGIRYFNPRLSIGREVSDTDGREYRSGATAIQLANLLQPGDDLEVTLTLVRRTTAYDERPSGYREDKSMDYRAGATRRLTPRWTLLASASYTANASNLDSLYSYNRVQLSLGASYTF